jgi:hypothetical protein
MGAFQFPYLVVRYKKDLYLKHSFHVKLKFPGRLCNPLNHTHSGAKFVRYVKHPKHYIGVRTCYSSPHMKESFLLNIVMEKNPWGATNAHAGIKFIVFAPSNTTGFQLVYPASFSTH